jgi:hypothetical protein
MNNPYLKGGGFIDRVTSGRTTAKWMIASFGVGLAIVLASYLAPGSAQKLTIALRATARWSFLLFWIASVGKALATLFGPRFRPLADHARDFALAFASAHLGLVAWGYLVAAGPRQTAPIIFVVAVFWTYLLALLSFSRFSSWLNPKFLKILRAVGVEYISCTFLFDFIQNPFDAGVRHFISYFPFLALAVAGPLLRVAAMLKRGAISRAKR